MSTLNGFKSDFRRSNRSVRKSTLIRIEKLKSISGMDQGFMSDEIGRFYFSLFFNKFFIEDFFPWQFSLNNSFQKKTYIFS